MLKNIEVTQDLLDYIYNHTQPLHPVQKDILAHNKTLGDIQRMQISEIQGHFLQLIIKINNVKNCLEIGTFTGFSAFTMALALPNGGKIITLDHDKKIVSVAKKFFKKGNLDNLIETEVSLIDCHDYDMYRKKLISYGLNDHDLSLMGLKIIEKKGSDIQNLVRIHEIRY